MSDKDEALQARRLARAMKFLEWIDTLEHEERVTGAWEDIRGMVCKGPPICGNPTANLCGILIKYLAGDESVDLKAIERELNVFQA